jgi:hypothetical protein
LWVHPPSTIHRPPIDHPQPQKTTFFKTHPQTSTTQNPIFFRNTSNNGRNCSLCRHFRPIQDTPCPPSLSNLSYRPCSTL